MGALLDRITGGRYRAARHRVVAEPSAHASAARVAATFFFRPAPAALLRRPPSPLLEGVAVREARSREIGREIGARSARGACPREGRLCGVGDICELGAARQRQVRAPQGCGALPRAPSRRAYHPRPTDKDQGATVQPESSGILTVRERAGEAGKILS